MAATGGFITNKLPLPIDIYLTFALGFITLILSGAVCVPKISRSYGFQHGLLIINGLLSLFWLADSILIVLRADNGSMIDKYFIDTQIFNNTFYDHKYDTDPSYEKKLQEITVLGTIVMVMSWLQFFLLALTIVVKFTEKQQDDDHPSSYDKDAPELDMEATDNLTLVLDTMNEKKQQKISKNKIGIKKQSSEEEYAMAKYNFRNQEDTDFKFKIGDRIRVVKRTRKESDWWTGEFDGKVGQFPGNYVRLL
ncbi:9486_t:CDS:2 [Ambispora gerdemannii]|uniref:9486_t:CDS:1 n=1 Tax=Ambispora gerdemannii TaxID=144530 RepID=A0A9N8Z5S8_9GLOM|nr:9486_t:CDS:2 [Ambispora gerdemannii]